MSEQREALADLIAVHDAYHVNEDGWTVCICGHVAVDDDDDGSHARHLADVLLTSPGLAREREEHTAALIRAWHEGYGAGSSDATDGWMKPGSQRTTNPYTLVTPPGQDANQ